MREEQNGLSEAVQKGMAASRAIRGAVKTGKAIAGAAKGASVGGAAGAVVGFAWGNRKVLAAIIIGAVALLLLPVVILCMLPSVIFGGLSNTDALNNPSAITQNIEDLKICVENVLSESLDQVLEEIEADRESCGEEGTSVENPYSDNLPDQTIKILAEYCAYNDADPQSCSKDELEGILRGYADSFFTYEKKEEENTIKSEIVIVDSGTGETTKEILTETETVAVYTVLFHDDLFDLTEEQQALANDYEENLKNFIEHGV